MSELDPPELTLSDLTAEDSDAPVILNPSTGPRTPEGKAIASANARTHGCCSRQIVMRDENQEDYDRLRAYWFNRFAPATTDIAVMTEDDEIKHALIQNAVDNQWLLLRAQRRFGEIEQHIDGLHAACWTAEDTQKFGLFQRYLGNAERAFHRALHVLEKYGKDHITGVQQAIGAPRPTRTQRRQSRPRKGGNRENRQHGQAANPDAQRSQHSSQALAHRWPTTA